MEQEARYEIGSKMYMERLQAAGERNIFFVVHGVALRNAVEEGVEHACFGSGAVRARCECRPSRQVGREVAFAGGAGTRSDRARNRVLTPDSSSPGSYYPLRAEDPTRRPPKCSGSLDRSVLGHLCTIRPGNSGNSVASLPVCTGARRARCAWVGQQVRGSTETGRQGRYPCCCSTSAPHKARRCQHDASDRSRASMVCMPCVAVPMVLDLGVRGVWQRLGRR